MPKAGVYAPQRAGVGGCYWQQRMFDALLHSTSLHLYIFSFSQQRFNEWRSTRHKYITLPTVSVGSEICKAANSIAAARPPPGISNLHLSNPAISCSHHSSNNAGQHPEPTLSSQTRTVLESERSEYLLCVISHTLYPSQRGMMHAQRKSLTHRHSCGSVRTLVCGVQF